MNAHPEPQVRLIKHLKTQNQFFVLRICCPGSWRRHSCRRPPLYFNFNAAQTEMSPYAYLPVQPIPGENPPRRITGASKTPSRCRRQECQRHD